MFDKYFNNYEYFVAASLNFNSKEYIILGTGTSYEYFLRFKTRVN